MRAASVNNEVSTFFVVVAGRDYFSGGGGFDGSSTPFHICLHMCVYV